MKNIIAHKVACMQDKIEPMPGENETNIGKLKIPVRVEVTFYGNLYLDLIFLSLDLDLYISNFSKFRFRSNFSSLDLYQYFLTLNLDLIFEFRSQSGSNFPSFSGFLMHG